MKARLSWTLSESYLSVHQWVVSPGWITVLDKARRPGTASLVRNHELGYAQVQVSKSGRWLINGIFNPNLEMATDKLPLFLG